MRRRTVLGVLCVIGSAAGPASTQTHDALSRILGAVAQKPMLDVPFHERRISPLFGKPAESRGTLSYRRSGVLEKTTTQPVRERLVLTAESLTIESGRGGPPRVVRLDTQPEAARAAQAVRAILAGDAAPLRQYFDVRLSGEFARWQLLLAPREASLRQLIREIRVAGEGGQVKVIETTEVSGDVTELSLLVGSTAGAQ